jgi:hypothetical protein
MAIYYKKKLKKKPHIDVVYRPCEYNSIDRDIAIYKGRTMNSRFHLFILKDKMLITKLLDKNNIVCKRTKVDLQE